MRKNCRFSRKERTGSVKVCEGEKNCERISVDFLKEKEWRDCLCMQVPEGENVRMLVDFLKKRERRECESVYASS